MPSQDELTTKIGLFNFAESYWRSAVALERCEVDATHSYAPVSFLYYHALELYLKSYLRSHGYSVKKLRDTGHDLKTLSEHAQRFSLHLDDEDCVVLQEAATKYEILRSRYIQTGSFHRPATEALDRTCRSLRETVGEHLISEGAPRRILSLKSRSRRKPNETK